MNEQPKSKVLILIIGVLLIANIIMLAFFINGNNNHKEKREKDNKENYVNDYLKNEVGFDASQLARYDSLSKRHREQLKPVFDDLSAERKRNFKALVAVSFSDSAIIDAANHIYEQHKNLELNMLRYVKSVRDICTDGQKGRFDTGFYKIFGKRGQTHKEK